MGYIEQGRSILCISLLIVLFPGCASALWVRNDDGKMELRKVLISTGPAKSEDVENKSPIPDILLPRP